MQVAAAVRVLLRQCALSSSKIFALQDHIERKHPISDLFPVIIHSRDLLARELDSVACRAAVSDESRLGPTALVRAIRIWIGKAARSDLSLFSFPFVHRLHVHGSVPYHQRPSFCHQRPQIAEMTDHLQSLFCIIRTILFTLFLKLRRNDLRRDTLGNPWRRALAWKCVVTTAYLRFCRRFL